MTSPAVASPAWNPDAPRPPTLHREPKGTLATARHYVGDLVYGANDGLITTFAVVAGVAGGALSSRATLIIGAANLFADGLSMAVGNYLQYSIPRRRARSSESARGRSASGKARPRYAPGVRWRRRSAAPALHDVDRFEFQPDRVDRPDVHDAVRHRRTAGCGDDRPVVACRARDAAPGYCRRLGRLRKRRRRRVAARQRLI